MEMPEEKKENKTWAIVGTVAAILLCGCPGLTMCLFGVVVAFGKVPDTSYNFGNSGFVPSWIGFALLCLALIFMPSQSWCRSCSCARRNPPPRLPRWTYFLRRNLLAPAASMTPDKKWRSSKSAMLLIIIGTSSEIRKRQLFELDPAKPHIIHNAIPQRIRIIWD